ncbi:MAG: hypothetical protein JWP09_660 [Candidatus Taylorbacteria bacterium]|nr:hypothetical protein [Candidatus Taylorbacteria bacterium]
MKWLQDWIKPEALPTHDLHPDFKIDAEGWSWNREYNEGVDGEIVCKSRYGFNEPALLDSCPFMAKIGQNEDPEITAKWIGLAYANGARKEELVEWSKRFPYAELIEDLDVQGNGHSESVVTKITD